MDTATIEISAPADEVYALVTDITNMGKWSPETHKTAWVDGADTAVPGAKFKGWNHTKLWGLPVKWSTTCVVRQTNPGRTFSFDTPSSGARWTYQFEPTADGSGCAVTETREEVSRPLLAKVAWLSPQVARERRGQLAAGMQVTLERLKAAAEAG